MCVVSALSVTTAVDGTVSEFVCPPAHAKSGREEQLFAFPKTCCATRKTCTFSSVQLLPACGGGPLTTATVIARVSGYPVERDDVDGAKSSDSIHPGITAAGF